MERFYSHGGPHVIKKICGQNQPYFKQDSRFEKSNVLDELNNETTDVSSGLFLENKKTLADKADGNPERFNDRVEAVLGILRTLSTVMKGNLLSCRL